MSNTIPPQSITLSSTEIAVTIQYNKILKAVRRIKNYIERNRTFKQRMFKKSIKKLHKLIKRHPKYHGVYKDYKARFESISQNIGRYYKKEFKRLLHDQSIVGKNTNSNLLI